jgi:uncharacterized circularly permuted ATP-grasp superfamily protein
VRVANAFFLTQGIGFTVYGDEAGTDRIFPFDLVPRIVPTDEWELIELGLVQRLRALNLFLSDVYHRQEILETGTVPTELVRSVKQTGALVGQAIRPASAAWLPYCHRAG